MFDIFCGMYVIFLLDLMIFDDYNISLTLKNHSYAWNYKMSENGRSDLLSFIFFKQQTHKGPSINDVTPKFGFFDPPPSPCHPMSPLAL